MVRDEIKKEIIRVVCEKWPNVTVPDFSLSAPEYAAHGDYASNVALVLAKTTKMSPAALAREIASGMKGAWFSRAEVAGPGFLNIFLSDTYYALLAAEFAKRGSIFGRGKKRKETIIIEYSSPNIAKPMGIHHLRSTVIGHALVNMYEFLGWRVLPMTFPGDWGTQFGSLIAAYKQWGTKEKIKKDPIGEMLALYVRFSAKAKEDSAYTDSARAEFKKLEAGDRENKKIWEWFRRESLNDFDRIYKRLGVKIPHVYSESFFEPMLAGVIEDALKSGVATKELDGLILVASFDATPPVLLRKTDGATLYITRDLAQMKFRRDTWRPDVVAFVVANQQSLHFEQLFRVSELLGYAKGARLTHVKFGMMLASEGTKFATREGKLIRLEDVLDEAEARAMAVVKKLNPKLAGKEKIARIVGIGALKFFDLHQNRRSDIVFDWDRMLSLKGASAPYIQYSYARVQSIRRKMGKRGGKPDFTLLKEEAERGLLHELQYFPEVVEIAAHAFEPNHVAEYLLRVAEKMNALYEKASVLKAEPKMAAARLGLFEAAANILKRGLLLLGIDMPEKM